jgi:hypothetical protein
MVVTAQRKISCTVATASQIIVVHEHNATMETALKRTMRG